MCTYTHTFTPWVYNQPPPPSLCTSAPATGRLMMVVCWYLTLSSSARSVIFSVRTSFLAPVIRTSTGRHRAQVDIVGVTRTMSCAVDVPTLRLTSEPNLHTMCVISRNVAGPNKRLHPQPRAPSRWPAPCHTSARLNMGFISS